MKHVLVVAIGLSVSACIAGNSPLDCTSDFDCGGGNSCADGVCETQDTGVPPVVRHDAGPPHDGGSRQPDGSIRDGGTWWDGDGGTWMYPDANIRDGGPGRDGGFPDGSPWPPPEPPASECTTPGQVACNCANGDPGMRWCRTDLTLGACDCGSTTERARLDRIQQGVIGAWEGTRTTIWDGTLPVWMVFTREGRYYAVCGGLCSSTYWGGDFNSPDRTYDIFDIYADDTGWGDISLMFGPSRPQQGKMDRIDLSTDENALQFELEHTVPNVVTFDLLRLPQP